MSEEKWADDLVMFHNPTAEYPVDVSLFPGIAHYNVVNDEVIWTGPARRILYSSTVTIDWLRREAGLEAYFSG